MRDEAQEESTLSAQRLCSEIQLFDLCDLASCRFICNRYCTNKDLLEKFESIKEEDDRQSVLYADEETDDESDTADFNDYDDAFEADEE